MRKIFSLIAILAIVAALFATATPAAAQAVAPYEPTGVGTFCLGTGPLVFESQIPADSWKCATEGTYALVQPWHSPAGPYNPQLSMTGLSWDQVKNMLDSKGWNSGSVWFVPTAGPSEVAAPSDGSLVATQAPAPTEASAPETPPTVEPQGFDWLTTCLWGLVLLVVIWLAIVAIRMWRRRRPAPPAPPAAPTP